MILAREELIKAVQDKHIEFSPQIEENQYGEASIDLRLGNSFTSFYGEKCKGITISISEAGISELANANLWKTKEIDSDEQFILKPGKFILGNTHESVKVPNNMIARIEGRSTYARFGISMHQTAPWIQPGWSGKIILEIMNHGPIQIGLIPFKEMPCQISFFQLTGEVPDEFVYGSKPDDNFQNQQHPLKLPR